MTNTTITSPETTEFQIVPAGAAGFTITLNGETLTWPSGHTRYFTTRNAARKRISRERKQSFHN